MPADTQSATYGAIPKRLKGAVLKTARRVTPVRGFESLSPRQTHDRGIHNMTYKLRNSMTTLKSRYCPKVEIKYPTAKDYHLFIHPGRKAYPIFPGLKNPSKNKKGDDSS